MICPVSSVGMNPLGTTQKSTAVATRLRPATAMTAGRCSRQRCSVQRYVASIPWKKRPQGRIGARGAPRGRVEERLLSMGVSVSDTKPETRMAALTVTANSRTNGRVSRHEENGMNTAARDRVMTDGEADLARSDERGLEGTLPLLHVTHDVLQHDDGVVDHEAHDSVSAMRERLSS